MLVLFKAVIYVLVYSVGFTRRLESVPTITTLAGVSWKIPEIDEGQFSLQKYIQSQHFIRATIIHPKVIHKKQPPSPSDQNHSKLHQSIRQPSISSIHFKLHQGADFEKQSNNKTIKQFLFGPIGR